MHTEQTQSNILTDLFSTQTLCFPHIKHPQSPITLYWCILINSLLILLFQFFFFHEPPQSYQAKQSKTSPLGLNTVNLFIKECVQYIFMVHISLVKTFHSIKHLVDHWAGLQRADLSPRLLLLLMRGTLEPHYSEHPLYPAAIRQASISKRHSRSPCSELERNE